MLATALTILENMDLDKEIVVSPKAIKDLSNASTVGLRIGDKLTVEQLLLNNYYMECYFHQELMLLMY